MLPPPSVPPSEAIAEYRSEPDEPPPQFPPHGFFSRPQVQKGNRNSIFIFVNGRLIRDRLLLHALSSAYHNLMPASSYPFALLFLECDCRRGGCECAPVEDGGAFPPRIVRARFRARHASRAADGEPPRAGLHSAPQQLPPAAGGRSCPIRNSARCSRMKPPAADSARRGDPLTVSDRPAGIAGLPEFSLRPTAGPRAAPGFQRAAPRSDARPAALRQASRDLDAHGEFPADAIPPPEMSLSALSDLRPLGPDPRELHHRRRTRRPVDHRSARGPRAHPVRAGDEAARRRTRGDAAAADAADLQLTPEQQIDYARIADELHASGFETEPFGNRTIAVKAAPAAVGTAELEKMLFEILETAEAELRGASLEDLRRNICASIACRAAIKINTRLDAAKMEWLLRALAATDCPMSCPHGRPIAHALFHARDSESLPPDLS